MTAHDLARRLFELPDFEIHLMMPNEEKGNTVYAIVSAEPAVSASGLVWLGIKRLYGPDPAA